jgi:uncharacterized protein
MEPTADEKQMAMFAHIGVILSFIVPLVIYLTKKDQSKYIAFHALQALIFQVVLAVVVIVCTIAAPFTCAISLLLIPIVGLGALVLEIMAGIKANEGQLYMLPIAGDYARKTLGP